MNHYPMNHPVNHFINTDRYSAGNSASLLIQRVRPQIKDLTKFTRDEAERVVDNLIGSGDVFVSDQHEHRQQGEDGSIVDREIAIRFILKMFEGIKQQGRRRRMRRANVVASSD